MSAAHLTVYWRGAVLLATEVTRPIVLAGRGASSLVCGADGFELPRGARVERDGAVLEPARWVPFDGTPLTVRHRGLVAVLAAPERLPSPPWRRPRLMTWLAVSVALHAAVLVAFWLMPPAPASLTLDTLRADDRMIRCLLTRATPEPSLDHGGAAGVEGSAPRSARRSRAPTSRREPRAPRRGRDVRRAEALDEAREAVASVAPSAPFRTGGAGLDDWADMPTSADAWGFERDPRLLAIGTGGGGRGDGRIGLGRVSTGCGGCGSPQRAARYGAGRTRGARPTPRVRAGSPHVVGALGPDAVRRAVHGQLREVRACYEDGLRARASLAGRVTVAWVIGPSGAVQFSSLSESDLADPAVATCVTSAVRRWTFPAPEAGPVGVRMAFVLAQR